VGPGVRNEAGGLRKAFLIDAASGLVSGFLYLSLILSFAFLIPIQSSFAGRGRRSGFITAGLAIAVITIGQGFRLMSIGAFDLGLCLASSVPPLLLLGAMGLINQRLGRLGAGTRILLVSAILSLAAAPFILSTTADKVFVESMKAYVTSAAESSGIDSGSLNGVDEAIGSSIRTVSSAFVPLIFWMLGFSWLYGSRMAARSLTKTPEERNARIAKLKLGKYKVPQVALWPTLATWIFLFVVLAAKLGGLASILAWNLALCSALLYAVQGLGIMGFLSERYPLARFLRLLAPLVVILIILNSTIGAITLIVLPMLGITEVWFPYRNFKGALK